MTDVILINPPHSFPEDSMVTQKRKGYTIYPPAGILYLASALENSGFKVQVIDAVAGGNSIANILGIINSSSAHPIVGISATTPQIRGGLQLATKIKQLNNKLCIGIGGPHVSADPAFIERFKVFDFAVIGEGEKTFPELIKESKEGGHLKGVYPGEPVADLDIIAFPNRRLVNSNDYYLEPYGRYFATIHPSRGCPFSCSFCSNPVGGRRARFRSHQNVVDEIEYCVKEFSVKHVLFTDDTFTLNMKHAAEICEEIMRRDIKITWSCETRANLVDRSLLELMHKAGCREISFGVESGNEELRERVLQKKVSDAELLTAFTECHQLGIDANAFCMLGFPGETTENMLETLDFVLKIKPDILGLHQTVLFPGSALYKRAVADGKISKDVWDKYTRGEVEEQPVYLPDGFSRQTVDNMQKHIYWKYYYRPAYLFRRFLKDISSFSRFKQDLRLGIGLLSSPQTRTGRP
jgi:anaerobic magnesium-protoporphyrin IX monomethyl ester cyclase